MKKLQPKFSNFNYRIVESTLDYHHEVEVTFDYGNKQAKRILYIPTLEDQPDSYYIERAKEKISDEIQDGTLVKYINKNFGNRPSSKTVLKAAVWVLAIATIASTGYLVYRFLPFNNRHKVTFISSGGSETPTQYVVDGEKAAKPADPSKPGYHFQYWCSDVALSQEYAFDTPVKKDLVLYPNWGEIDKFTLTFIDNFNGLSGDTPTIDTEVVDYGSTWSDIREKKFMEVQEKAKSNYRPTYFSFDEDGSSKIDDTFVFDSADKKVYNIYIFWEVHFNFKNDLLAKGTLPHEDCYLPADKSWNECGESCEPINVKPGWKFVGLTYQALPPTWIDENEPLWKYAQYDSAENLTVNYDTDDELGFKEAPWDAFVYEIGKYDTINDLLTNNPAYRAEYEQNHNTFVGLTREIELEGASTKAHLRVIDQIDPEASRGENDPFFTFEFVEALPAVKYSTTGSNIYNGSNLQTYLNSTIYFSLPEDVRAAIKPTEIGYFDGTFDEEGDPNIAHTTDNLFVLSSDEIARRNEDYPRSRFQPFDPLYPNGMLDEGKTYDFYYNADASTRSKRSLVGGSPVSYWLRSSDYTVNDAAWFINKNDGSLGEYQVDESGTVESYTYDVSTELYVVPVFRI